MEKRYLTINELSEYLNVKKRTIYLWTMQKKIPHSKLGGKLLRFEPDKVDEWLKRQECVDKEKY